MRFAQRLVHLLTMHSAAGRLYEVDVRLRPSGKGGLLVTNIEAFAEYQRDEAWTWEHQALLHARAVAGDARAARALRGGAPRGAGAHVRRDSLREEVRACASACAVSSARRPGRVRSQAGPGGIADIEFLAQYWALCWAQDYPPVAMFSDTIRQLESVASADLVPQASVDVLTAAYRSYRASTHRLSLDGAPAVVPAAQFAQTRAAVTALWQATMSAAAPDAQVLMPGNCRSADRSNSHGRDGQAAHRAQRAESI